MRAQGVGRSLRANPVAGFLFVLLLSSASFARQAGKNAPESPAAMAKRGIALAEQGDCFRALPLLEKSIAHIEEKQLRYGIGMATAQCALLTDRTDALVRALLLLNREFPNDPRVLYVTTHDYSEIANRFAHKLLKVAPASPEAMELVAEAYAAQENWKAAEKEYRKILAKSPNQPGVHYQLGRMIMQEPETPTSDEEARKEFEAELKIDPASASAEFMLGNLAWKNQNWPEAIEHFSKAAKLDASLDEAYLGLGISLNATGRYSQAIAPLEKYVKAEPGDPAGHYQLAIAYARTGRKADADREMLLQQKTQQEAQHDASAGQNPG